MFERYVGADLHRNLFSASCDPRKREWAATSTTTTTTTKTTTTTTTTPAPVEALAVADSGTEIYTRIEGSVRSRNSD